MSELTHYLATHVPILTAYSQHPGVEVRFEGGLFIAGQQSQKVGNTRAFLILTVARSSEALGTSSLLLDRCPFPV